MSSVFAAGAGHEQVLFCSDQPSGLKAIIAIHSTALGPALGGTRMRLYPDEDAALADVLALSEAMTYKAACAGLDFGGGKAVIIADPARDKSEALLRAYGRFLASLGGRYVTACDVGTYVDDMDVVARECRWVTGRSPGYGGSGDSGILTAYGVFEAMRACAQHLWGSPSLAGRRVAVSGVGKVGRRLVGHLVDARADVVAADVDPATRAAVAARYPEVGMLDDPADLVTADVDVFAPCALGGALTPAVVASLRARVVCGGANNQLAEPGVDVLLSQAGVLYAPDFVVNAGGLVQVADEFDGYIAERARGRAAKIFDTTLEVFARASRDGVTTAAAAHSLARDRISAVGRLRTLLASPADRPTPRHREGSA